MKETIQKKGNVLYEKWIKRFKIAYDKICKLINMAEYSIINDA